MKKGKMTNRNSFVAAVLCMICSFLAFTSCQDSGYGDDNTTAQKAYGNDTITERPACIKTISELCNMPKYKTTMSAQRGAILVDEDIQLKLRVTGNDQGGNIYNKVAMQDENGDPIFITIYTSGLHSYLSYGQQVLINLKGLYIGTYGYQCQVGVPYTTASGNTYAGRMPNYLWQQHFKLLGTPDPTAPEIQPIEFNSTMDISKYAGRLMTVKGVEMRDADGKTTWADIVQSVQEDEDNTEFSTTRFIKGFPANVFVYTSTSAKFAGEVMPKGKLNITGIFSRYGSDWQILIRTKDDIEVANQ